MVESSKQTLCFKWIELNKKIINPLSKLKVVFWVQSYGPSKSVGRGSHDFLHRFVPSFLPSADVLQHAAQWVQLSDACVGITQTQHMCIVWSSFESGMLAFREMPVELLKDSRPVPAGFCMGERTCHHNSYYQVTLE